MDINEESNIHDNNDHGQDGLQDLDSSNRESNVPSPTPVFGRTRETFQQERETIQTILQECAKVIVGQKAIIEKMLICLIGDGHVLLEGVPGIAKTLSAKVLAQTVDSGFTRIQFTPDLMPADILGTSIFNLKSSKFKFKKGPIFDNIILIDEINRAPAKTQAALFEAMEEKQVSFDGKTLPLEFPFMVIATQNPVEQEGTYRLPEAQLDRFMMRIILDYPTRDEEIQILKRFKNQVGALDLSHIAKIINPDQIKVLQEAAAQVVVEDQMLSYITSLVLETRENAKLYLGASPRASLAILKASKIVAMVAGRSFVIPDDIQYIAPDILNHRIILSPEAEMSGETPSSIISGIIKNIEVPR